MARAAEILESEKEAFGRIMAAEMGKTLKSAMDEAAKSAWGCRYYAEHAERFLADEVVETTASRSFVTYQPIGPVLAVMPWNFPFWQVFRFAAPALMAGNVGLLKHASNVPQCALAIEEIFRRAGFAEGVFQTLLIETDQVKSVIEDRRVAAVTLTGSNAAGSQVASTAGRSIKKIGARARRQRSLHRDARCRSRGRGGDRGEGPGGEQRPIVHRGQAFHRGRARGRRVRAPFRGRDGGAGGRRSDGSRRPMSARWRPRPSSAPSPSRWNGASGPVRGS